MLPIILAIIAINIIVFIATRIYIDHDYHANLYMRAWIRYNGFPLNEDYSINPNARNENGTPCLIKAVTENKSDVIQNLLKLGADPNAMDNKGQTALFHASSPEIVHQLCRAGAEPNALDVDGKSAIFYIHNSDVLHALKRAGANFNLKDPAGKTVLFYTTDHSSFDTLVALGCDLQHKDPDGNLATHQQSLNDELNKAVDANDLTRARAALEKGADPRTRHRDIANWNMLILAVHRQSTEMIELLLEFGADPREVPGAYSALFYSKSIRSAKVDEVYRKHGYI